MPGQSKTIGELYRAGTVTEEQIRVAVDAYMRDPTIDCFELADGVVLDLAAAVQSHKPAKDALAKTDAGRPHRRTMVRTAIVMARAKA